MKKTPIKNIDVFLFSKYLIVLYKNLLKLFAFDLSKKGINIVSGLAKGTNDLIKQGAKLVTNFSEVLEDL